MSQAAILNATQLYFSAQFDECIDACERIPRLNAFSEEQRSQIAFLTARSMLRLEQSSQAEELLSDVGSKHRTADAKATSSMLVAMARIRRGMPDDGLELLQAANGDARTVHRSIRSEIELYTAYAYFAKRDIPSALRAIERVEPGSDAIHARALQLQGFCHSWNGRKRTAAASFLGALVRLDSCKHRDYAVAAVAIAGLAVMAYELNDSLLMQHAEQRYAAMRWPIRTLRYRHEVEACVAYHADFVGDLAKAADFAVMALNTGRTDPALQAGSYSQLARIAHHSRDHSAARASLDAGLHLIDNIPDSKVQGSAEATWAMLELVRESALYDVVGARALFARYKTIKQNQLNMSSYSVQLRAELRLIEGLMFVSENRIPEARKCFREAHDAYRTCEFVCEAVEAAHWLAVLGDASMEWYVAGSLAGKQNWMTRVCAVTIS